MSIPETGQAKHNPNPYNIHPLPMPGGDLTNPIGSTLPGPIGLTPHFKTPSNLNWPRTD